MASPGCGATLSGRFVASGLPGDPPGAMPRAVVTQAVGNRCRPTPVAGIWTYVATAVAYWTSGSTAILSPILSTTDRHSRFVQEGVNYPAAFRMRLLHLEVL